MNTSQLTINPKSGTLSSKLAEQKINNLSELLVWLRALPYSRNSDRSDYTLVLSEHKGTCSTKHALTAAVAQENNWQDVELYLGFFFMDAELYPRLRNILTEAGLEGIPEAHTFLVIDGEYTDVSSSNNPITEDMIVDEMEIEPQGIGTLKESVHKGFISEWIEDEKINLPPDQIWSIREACIAELSKA